MALWRVHGRFADGEVLKFIGEEIGSYTDPIAYPSAGSFELELKTCVSVEFVVPAADAKEIALPQVCECVLKNIVVRVPIVMISVAP